MKNLDAVVHPVAHVHQAIVRDDDAVWRAEVFEGVLSALLRYVLELRWIERRSLVIAWLVAVCAPKSFELAGVLIEDNYPAVAVSIGNIHFVHCGIIEDLR